MLKKYTYTIYINAEPEKVWKTMLEDKTYREWTSVFSPDSHYEGSWETGSKIKFLGRNEDGTYSGMLSKIAVSKPYEYVAIEHIGQVDKGVEDTTSDAVKSWIGAEETYTFKSTESGTELVVSVDYDPEWGPQMDEMWQKSLALLKALCEA